MVGTLSLEISIVHPPDKPKKEFNVDEWWAELQTHPMFMEKFDESAVSDEVAALQVGQFKLSR